ncbi:MAG: hypothetical protein ACI9UU_002492 [Candidatus Azotimanducaceae bacterium]|jgi:uncharacterized protein (DUF1330 family)
MHYENSVSPSETQMAEFAEAGPEGPIYLVNLLKFREKAEYQDGRATDLTGKQAYGIYSASVSVLLKEFGGGGLFSAQVSRLMLGEVEELWDQVAIAMYPSRQAMLQMIQSPKMQEIGIHRAAGLAGQLNIETADAKGIWLGDSVL